MQLSPAICILIFENIFRLFCINFFLTYNFKGCKNKNQAAIVSFALIFLPHWQVQTCTCQCGTSSKSRFFFMPIHFIIPNYILSIVHVCTEAVLASCSGVKSCFHCVTVYSSKTILIWIDQLYMQICYKCQKAFWCHFSRQSPNTASCLPPACVWISCRLVKSKMVMGPLPTLTSSSTRTTSSSKSTASPEQWGT